MKKVVAVIMVVAMYGTTMMAERTGRPSWFGFGFNFGTDDKQAWLRVQNVAPGGPAALAGLQPHDMIVSIGGKKIQSRHALDVLQQLAAVQPGSPLKIGYFRDQQLRSATLRGLPMTDEQMAAWQRHLKHADEEKRGVARRE